MLEPIIIVALRDYNSLAGCHSIGKPQTSQHLGHAYIDAYRLTPANGSQFRSNRNDFYHLNAVHLKPGKQLISHAENKFWLLLNQTVCDS